MPHLENKGFIVLNFVYGFGPFTKTTELAVKINDLLEKEGMSRMGIIVPWIYGEDQKRILEEEFGAVIRKHPEEILLDKKLGGILDSVFYVGEEGFDGSLKRFVDRGESANKKIADYFKKGLCVETFGGEKFEIKKEYLAFELNRCPRVYYPLESSYYTGFGYSSEILDKASKLDLGINKELMKESAKLFKKIEGKSSVHFISGPGVFFSHDYKKRKKTEIDVPPTLNWPLEENMEKIKKGIYVTVSGISGLESLYAGVKNMGLEVYSNRPNVLGFGTKKSPNLISNKNIKFHFARTGWGSVWQSQFSGVPLITMPYKKGDDPEIYFNNKTLEALGLAKIYKGESAEELFDYTESFKKNVGEMNAFLMKKYDTLNGNDIIAREILKDLKKGHEKGKNRGGRGGDGGRAGKALV